MNLIFPDKPVPFVRVTRGYFRHSYAVSLAGFVSVKGRIQASEKEKKIPLVSQLSSIVDRSPGTVRVSLI